MSNCTAFVLFVQFLTSIDKLYFDAVSVFHAGAPGFEEVTQLIDHYFAEGNVGVSFDQRHPVLSKHSRSLLMVQRKLHRIGWSWNSFVNMS